MLASYCCPTGACTLLLCNRQDLAPLRLRYDPDNPSCRYAYDSVACIVLLPQTDKPRAVMPTRRPRRWHRTATRTDKSRADMPTDPALAPYCHRQVPAYDHEY